MDINLDILLYTFYSLLPYMYMSNWYISLLLWKIPNTFLSMIVFSHYISLIDYPITLSPRYPINIVNGRYYLIRKISSNIEASILGLIFPIIYSIAPQFSHIVNCIIVAEVLYAQYDIRRRLKLYSTNLLRISLYGIPLTLLQMHVIDSFILNYLYNVLLIIQVQWMSKYPLLHKLHSQVCHHKIM
jgi:hypothetical protein